MSVLVLGGTGTVGSAVVAGLRERGEEVRVLTRSPEKAEDLPDGVNAVVGDLLDPGTYDEIFAGLDRLFLLNTVAETELQQGLAALNEARRRGARRLVYISVQDVERGWNVPHFASKIAIENALRQSGLRVTILRPNNFYQNDHWFRDAIVEHGVYPQPIGRAGVSRVDVRDIADAAVRALVSGEYEGRAYTIAGPDALTGEACAAAYAEALGREVVYAGDDLDAWQEQALQMLPSWMVYDFRLMYAMFQEEGLAASGEQLEETRTIVGHEPRSFRQFVDELAVSWTS